MYSLVVPVKVVAMVQVGYILQCMLLCYLHEPRACGPLSCKYRSNLHLGNLYVHTKIFLDWLLCE